MARKGKHKGAVGKSKRGHGVKRNPHAKVLYTNIGGLLYRNRILPNKKKDVKPEIEE
mgnify:CR=1 FL=1|jgi:hypothetical protein